MHSIWFGEFMGTLVLVLLGNGVNAGVTLRKSYAADSGWMVITTGWALAVLCGVMVAQAFGSPGAHLNPAIYAGRGGNQRKLCRSCSIYWSAQLLGAMSGAALDDPALCAALEAHARSRGQAGRLLHQCGGAQPAGEHLQRDVGHGGAGGRGRCDLLARRGHERTGCGTWDRGWWAAWCGASDSRSAEPRAMRSTRRAIWGRASFMRCCRFPARADRTGAMRRFRSSATLPEERSRDCCCTTRIFERRLVRPKRACAVEDGVGRAEVNARRVSSGFSTESSTGARKFCFA